MLWWNYGLSMGSSFQCISVLSWNILGLGELDKRRVVKDALATAKDSVFCLQETKLSDVDLTTAHPLLPPSHATSFHSDDVDGSHGGLLTAWDSNALVLKSFITRRHTLTIILSLGMETGTDN
jgi:hypothetical protein